MSELTLWQAVEKRFSCRAYQKKLIDEETQGKLARCLQELNRASGLHFQLYVSKITEQSAVKMAAAMFDGGVYAYAALVGGNDPISSEKVGYYGEKFALYATQLGLGSCWVASTYNSRSIAPKVDEGEKVWDIMPLGYAVEPIPAKQAMVRSALRGRDRKPEQFVESEIPYYDLPAWVKKGVEAVLLAPSAVNQQPVNFVYQDGVVKAKIWKNGHGMQFNDMGIAKYHFEVGAAEAGVKGHWELGDGGAFVVE